MPDKKFVKDLNRLIRQPKRKRLLGALQRAAMPASTGTIYMPDEDNLDAIASVGNVAVFYMVTSQMVTDPEGNWEFPSNFPTDNTYPGITGGPDQSVYLISRRVHERGLVDEDGTYFREVVPMDDWEQPYVGDGTYAPTYSVMDLTAAAPSGFSTAFSELPWTTILADVNSRYGIP